MAAFHPRTFELLRADLAGETVTHTLDTARLAKLPDDSQSLMAQQLRTRIRTFPPVSRDLERLIEFAEGVNQLYTAHHLGAHDATTPHSACPACQGGEPA